MILFPPDTFPFRLNNERQLVELIHIGIQCGKSQSAPARLMAQLRPQLPYMNFYRFCQLLEKNHPKAPIIGSGWWIVHSTDFASRKPHPRMRAKAHGFITQ